MVEADLHSVVFAPSIVYAPGDPWLTLLERLALLPVMPVTGRGEARFQPIWAEDVADCVVASLREAASGENGQRHRRYELAGPETLSHSEIVATVLRALRPQPSAACTCRRRSSRARCGCSRRRRESARSRPGTRPS